MTFTKYGDSTVGMIYQCPNLAFRPRSDFLLFNSQARLTVPAIAGIDPQKIVLTYYYWDSNYRAFETPEKYREFLKRYRDCGVNKTAFHDFSTWYQEPEQKRYDTILRAFEYAELASSMGFELTWNNNLSTARFDEISKLLPARIETYIVSANHREDIIHPQAIRDGRNTYEIMIRQKKAKRVLFITNRKNQTDMNWFFDGRIKVSVIPRNDALR